MLQLKTKRLLLRPVQLKDKDAIFTYRSDNVTNQHQGWIPKTPDEVKIFILKTQKEINQPETWYQLVIIDNDTHKVIGDLGLHFFGKENKQVEIGCTLHRDFQQNGYATEALQKTLTYLFVSLNKHRIIASIDPANKKAEQLVTRLGFRKEAHFRQSLWLHGKWVDDVIYALLHQDWKTSNQNDL